MHLKTGRCLLGLYAMHYLTRLKTRLCILGLPLLYAYMRGSFLLNLSKFWFLTLEYHIQGNRTPFLIRTPGDTFWAHYGHFWRKIVEKLPYFRTILTKLTIVRSLKIQKIDRTQALYLRRYGKLRICFCGKF